jgi:hypothetical protein
MSPSRRAATISPTPLRREERRARDLDAAPDLSGDGGNLLVQTVQLSRQAQRDHEARLQPLVV